MFKPNTVVVLGAGASFEAGFPVGVGLAKDISDLYSRGISGLPDTIERYLGSAYNGVPNIRRELDVVIRQISSEIVHYGSIDNYVHMREGAEYVDLMAKLAIVHLIAFKEKKSQLFVRSSYGSVEKVQDDIAEDTWYDTFFKIAIDGIRTSSLDQLFENVTVINFNYDRSLEQFLKFRLQSAFSSVRQNSFQLIEQLKVLRPYGSLGPLNELSPSGGEHAFGGCSSVSEIEHALMRLKTYVELTESDVQREISEAMTRAETVVYLGFGYHTQNMTVLRRSRPSELIQIDGWTIPRVFGTTFGASDIAALEFENRVLEAHGTQLTQKDTHFKKKECGPFIREISEALKH